jgi:hypothetical protein
MGVIGTWVVVAALAAATPKSRLELSVGGDVGYASSSLDPYSHTVLGQAGLTLTIYAQRPLADDDAPYALQPFLQRAGRVWLTASGGGSDFTYAAGFAGPQIIEGHRHASAGAGGAGFDLYVHRWVAIDASFSVDGGHAGGDTGAAPTDTLGIHGSAGAGLRWRDLRFDLGYRIDGRRDRSPYSERWQNVYYGHVYTSAQAVVRQRVSLLAQIDVIDHGALAWGALTVHPLKRLDLFAGLGGGRGGSGTSIPVDYIQARIGLGAWQSRHLGVVAAYSLSWTRIHATILNSFEPNAQLINSITMLEHLVSLTFTSRLN